MGMPVAAATGTPNTKDALVTTVDLTKSGPNGAATVTPVPAHRAGGRIYSYGIECVLIAMQGTEDYPQHWTMFSLSEGCARTGTVYETTAVEYPDPATTMRAMSLSATNRIDRETRAQSDMAQRHDEWRTAVRDAAIDHHVNGNWCKEGLNEALRDLGLETYETHFTVSVTMHITATVEADDEDDARAILADSIVHDDNEAIGDVEITRDRGY